MIGHSHFYINRNLIIKHPFLKKNFVQYNYIIHLLFFSENKKKTPILPNQHRPPKCHLIVVITSFRYSSQPNAITIAKITPHTHKYMIRSSNLAGSNIYTYIVFMFDVAYLYIVSVWLRRNRSSCPNAAHSKDAESVVETNNQTKIPPSIFATFVLSFSLFGTNALPI